MRREVLYDGISMIPCTLLSPTEEPPELGTFRFPRVPVIGDFIEIDGKKYAVSVVEFGFYASAPKAPKVIVSPIRVFI